MFYSNDIFVIFRISYFIIYNSNVGTGRKQSSLVGFSVFKKINQSYVAGETIQFEGEMYNDGGYYSLTSNMFQCPYTGIYYFVLNLKKSGI